MTLAIISHPDCVLHDAGKGHPERPERVQVIQQALQDYPFKKPVQFYEAPEAAREDLLRAHDKEYIDWIFASAPKRTHISIDEDTVMNPYTLDAALRAAGSVILAVDLVMTDKVQAVFCNVRPPGHHAERDRAMGFCFFNNVAVGAHYALAKYNLQRVAIVDFDVHHGNGTQNIFQKDKRVLYCSSFQHPFYPGYDEEFENSHIASVLLGSGTTGEEYREKVAAAWFNKLLAFKPELIFFSAGFDAHTNDPLANINLQVDDYVWLTQQIADIAKKTSHGRMISALEGGYNLEVLAECVPAHVNAMDLSA